MKVAVLTEELRNWLAWR